MKSAIYLVKVVYSKNMCPNIRRRCNLYIFILQIFTNVVEIINILLKQIKYIEIYNK